MTQRMVSRFESSRLDTPLLPGLTEVDFFKDLLSTQAFDEDSQKEIRGFEARILKKHLRKTIIEYTLTFASSTKRYIGIYRESDERLEHVFSILKTLRANGFADHSQLNVPRPIVYISTLSFILMDKAEGELLREILRGKDNPTPYVRGAAEWLAKLHGSKIRLDNVSSRKDEVAATLRYARALTWHFPRLTSEIKSISDKMVSLQEANPPGPRKPIHGDYHPRNIISSPGITTVIDLEEAGMGDPAFDLGYFVAQTKMTHGRDETITRATESFVEAYLEKQPSTPDDFLQRVNVFEAQTYLQRIYHTYYLLDLKPDVDKVAEWLNECRTSLQKATAEDQ
jgi:aminoglycoside phosphotransferase (APT) family kinase protein